MNELLRYIWLHGTERAASEWLVYTILFLVALGSVIKSKLFFLRDVEAIVAAVVVSSALSSQAAKAKIKAKTIKREIIFWKDMTYGNE